MPQAKWRFALDQAAPDRCHNTLLVQEVEVVCEITPCNDKPRRETFKYWERWTIQRNAKEPNEQRKKPIGGKPQPRKDIFTDLATFPAREGCGSYTQSTKIRAFCFRGDNTLKAALDKWFPGGARSNPISAPTWGKICPTSSGSLYSTNKQPEFWDDIDLRLDESEGTRFFSVKWQCCGSPTSVETTTTPPKSDGFD
jgi:hypothetical protein